jgi:hypothetical protein
MRKGLLASLDMLMLGPLSLLKSLTNLSLTLWAAAPTRFSLLATLYSPAKSFLPLVLSAAFAFPRKFIYFTSLK